LISSGILSQWQKADYHSMRFLAFALTVQHSTLLLSQTISIILYGRAFRLFPVFQNNNYHNKNNAN
jgi:pullulanase/glycogen debranching enzyme